MSIDDSLKKITKGAGLVLLGIVISKIFGYIYRVLIARIGTEEYGLLSIGIAIFSLLATIPLLGLDKGVLRYLSFYKGLNDLERMKGVIFSALNIAIPLSIIVSLLLFLFSEQLSLYFFHTTDLTLIFKIFSVAFPIVAFREIIASSFQAFQKVEYEIYFKNIIENVTKILLTLLFLFIGFKIIGFALAYVLGVLGSTILAFILFKKNILSFFKATTKTIYCKKELIFFSVPLIFGDLIFSIITWTDTLMLGYFKTPSDVGIYNAAQPTAFLLYIIPAALLTLFVPVLTELYAKNKNDDLIRIYYRVTKWIFIINTIFLGILFLFSKEILNLLFGENYIIGSTALIILSAGYFLGHLFTTSGKILFIIKKTNVIFFNTLVMVILNIILNLYLIPRYGITGAAIATSSTFFLRAILFLIESKIFIGNVPLKLSYIKLLFSAVSSFFIVRYLIKYLSINLTIYYLILFSILFILIYIIFLTLTKSLEKEDIFILNSIKRKFLRF